MAIRQTPSAGVASNVITGSAYASADAIGNPFAIEYAAGAFGAWLGTVKVFDYASAGTGLRLHLYNNEPSAINPSGTPFAIADTDDAKYLGFVDVTTWVSAGAAKRYAVVTEPGIALHAQSGARHVWGQWQARDTFIFGDHANPLHVYMATLQDGNT